MKKNPFIALLKPGDLRTTGNVNVALMKVKSQKDFDELFAVLFTNYRGLVLRAADAIEKITITNPGYLQKHRKALLKLLDNEVPIELKWHVAQLIPRLILNKSETGKSWKQLCTWVINKNESRIVRVNSLQALIEIASCHPEYKRELDQVIGSIKKEKVPSILARIRKLEKSNALLS